MSGTLPATVLTVLLWAAAAFALGAALFAALVLGLVRRYAHHIDEWLSKAPLLVPPAAPPARADRRARPVRFRSADRRPLRGTYYCHTAARRRGVVLFCHEFGGDGRLARHYAAELRGAGFDLFAMDFAGHGRSPAVPDTPMLPWVGRHEADDVRGALAYLADRPDADPAGVGVFGVSRGAGAAVAAAAGDPAVRAVVTDGFYPNHTTVMVHMRKYVDIYVPAGWLNRRMPWLLWWVLAGWALRRVARRNGTEYLRLEDAAADLRCPWLLVHGERDGYIPVTVIERLLAGSRPRAVTAWVVPKAKHNRCREAAGTEYARRVAQFFADHLDAAGEPLPAPHTDRPGRADAAPAGQGSGSAGAAKAPSRAVR